MTEAAAPRRVDRAALVRRALVRLAAERGFAATSMADVAAAAGVAAGTIYVHYGSKDELVVASYCEVKARLAGVASEAAVGRADAEQGFRAVWRAIYEYLRANPEEARFLAQIDAAPIASRAHEEATAGDGGKLVTMAAAIPGLVDLPPAVLYELALGPAVRLVADGQSLDPDAVERVVTACWRAITTPDAG